MHPLPRSLEPIPEESLVGYLLRLTHRIGVPPLHLVRMLGWQTGFFGNRFSRSVLFELDDPHIADLARLTRLTAEEASDLTLSSWKGRYPPIRRSLANGISSARPDGWLFLSNPRFCPRCLAGDGSSAQELHGGPWRKSWHLPIVFICAEHRAFLQSRCPQCEHSWSGSPLLIQRPNDATLHPAQCRRTFPDPTVPKRKTRACGYRLDQIPHTSDTRPQPPPHLIRFQQDILRRLDSSAPAQAAAEYFTDLRLVADLLSASWPQAQELVDTGLAGHVTAHVHERAAEHRGTSSNPHRYQVIDAAPRDAVACAGLLQAAQRVLAESDLSDTLAPLVQAAFRERGARFAWTTAFARHEDACSERMRTSAEPLTEVPPLCGRC
ncbi:TniQ family protein [Streptomyces sp. 11x1]|uniref:TniQ family protein n=1 Tax=Streptomyces sp. 11x1 TaxID=3038642 RepID=UPI0037DA6C72